jgi:hypothetical protein
VIYLRLSEHILADQVDDLLKVWPGIIFDHPHRHACDEGPHTDEVDTPYAHAVAKRFGQIGLRHHRSKKNRTDGGQTLGHVRARDLDNPA